MSASSRTLTYKNRRIASPARMPDKPALAAAAKRGAFLHDIGKALTHEAEGSHAKVGLIRHPDDLLWLKRGANAAHRP